MGVTSALGVLLGWIAWRAGSIVPGMCVHALVNLTFMGVGALAMVITRDRGLTHMQGVAVLPGLAVASLLATIVGRQHLATAPPA
jgi:Type II CAAX prenyl endopeptidase Rce1-like